MVHSPFPNTPRIVAWEMTRRCVLRCRHCRGNARDTNYDGELSLDECHLLVDQIAKAGTKLLILTGGEPMAHPHFFQLAGQAAAHGMRVVASPCGHLLDQDAAQKMVAVGISRISLSLDHFNAQGHDGWRGETGAFAVATRAIGIAQAAGIEVQINSTISRHNAHCIGEMFAMALSLKAVAWDCFFLVPTGRGAEINSLVLDAGEMETALSEILALSQRSPIPIKTTCAPQVVRMAAAQCITLDPRTNGGGCMAGRGFAFISHTGLLQPCGFLPHVVADLRTEDFDLARVYAEGPRWNGLQNPDGFHGGCGTCHQRYSCGGCRARALAATGDMLGSEPGCARANS
jgi:radical SAM protein with 4Fe4S-binding SPASM domain